MKTSAERRGGKVSIAVLPSLTINLLPGILARFKDANPGVRVILRDDNARGVQRQVLNNESDFGISNRWEEDSELKFFPLTLDPVGLVYPPDHPLGKNTRSRGASSPLVHGIRGPDHGRSQRNTGSEAGNHGPAVARDA
ncbi:MAG: LysR substrate-binding domain-containing protein [Gammaproteobacteria bacterium]|nr:LysR substrate-binding domain-containing protein [Gammaproteobacteria bacterium]